MSMYLDSGSLRSTGLPPRAAISDVSHRRNSQTVKIALVNNMPDSAFDATERQFVRLVNVVTPGLIDIQLFHIPGVPRGDAARAQMEGRYRTVHEMFNMEIDAVIVTGNEPRAARLNEEPYWRDLTRVIDWAMENTVTSLWSCLAAHAAVLHLDGIERRRLQQKTSGVLTCSVADPVRTGLPSKLSVCHSRMNELSGNELSSHGYEIVSVAAGGQVDSFTKTFSSRFLFLQGHPEYDADSLMREYRRDVGRYLNGTRDFYPDVPEGYFDITTIVRMENYRTMAERSRDIRLFNSFPTAELRPSLETRLADSAEAVFGNWLSAITVPTELA